MGLCTTLYLKLLGDKVPVHQFPKVFDVLWSIVAGIAVTLVEVPLASKYSANDSVSVAV